MRTFGRASDFEYRHRFLILAVIYVVAYAAYNIDRVNIVSVFSRYDGVYHITINRIGFAVGAAIAALGFVLRLRGVSIAGTELLLIGFGFFQSRLGFLLLVVGSLVFVLRLTARDDPRPPDASWRSALARDWYLAGYVLTLIAFVIVPRDRVGYRGTALTLCAWMVDRVVRNLRLHQSRR